MSKIHASNRRDFERVANYGSEMGDCLNRHSAAHTAIVEIAGQTSDILWTNGGLIVDEA